MYFKTLIITDRDELDKQIEGVMKNAGVISDEPANCKLLIVVSKLLTSG